MPPKMNLMKIRPANFTANCLEQRSCAFVALKKHCLVVYLPKGFRPELKEEEEGNDTKRISAA